MPCLAMNECFFTTGSMLDGCEVGTRRCKGSLRRRQLQCGIARAWPLAARYRRLLGRGGRSYVTHERLIQPQIYVVHIAPPRRELPVRWPANPLVGKVRSTTDCARGRFRRTHADKQGCSNRTSRHPAPARYPPVDPPSESAAGRYNVNDEPAPTWLATVISPRIWCASCRLIARPNPVPACSRVYGFPVTLPA